MNLLEIDYSETKDSNSTRRMLFHPFRRAYLLKVYPEPPLKAIVVNSNWQLSRLLSVCKSWVSLTLWGCLNELVELGFQVTHKTRMNYGRGLA
jgi:hypothetical protein